MRRMIFIESAYKKTINEGKNQTQIVIGFCFGQIKYDTIQNLLLGF